MFFSDDLLVDRDAYLAIAKNVAEGNGYRCRAAGNPTAFRPPLYPLLLAPFFVVHSPRFGVALLNVLAGVGTVGLTFWLGRELLAECGAWLAAALVAVDPLLLRYTAFPMTETCFTLLLLLTVVLGYRLLSTVEAVKFVERGQPALTGQRLSASERERAFSAQRRLAFVTGVTFGVCALCRPTAWAFGALVLAVWAAQAVWTRLVQVFPFFERSFWDFCLRVFRRERVSNQGDADLRRTEAFLPEDTDRSRQHSTVSLVLFLALGTAVVVAPWAVRNRVVLGRFILTTTHGGYTLLLGNNPVFYHEVVQQSWGTVWRGDSLKKWQQSVKQNMQQRLRQPNSELEQDAWCYRQALANIQQEPFVFLKACWLRVRRFWALKPLGPAQQQMPSWLLAFVGVYNALLLLLMPVGLFRLWRRKRNFATVLLLLLLSFTLVHAVYWSNARMRAPLVPVVILLATASVCVKDFGGPGLCNSNKTVLEEACVGRQEEE